MTAERVQTIEQALELVFAPRELQVKDQSHLHAGHAGAREGLGHFDVTISAEKLDDRSRVQSHQMIYEALGDLMKTDIHALKITVKKP